MENNSQHSLRTVRALPEFSIQHLLQEFNISKPTLYGYFKSLGTTPTRIGQAAYIAEDDYDKLQQLIAVLQQSKNMKIAEATQQLRERGFEIPEIADESDSEPQVKRVVRQVVNPSGLPLAEDYESFVPSAIQNFLTPSNSPTVKGVMKMGRIILAPLAGAFNNIARSMDSGVAAFEKANPSDPLRQHKILKEAADEEFVLPSSQLAAILDLEALPSARSFQRIGFKFTKVGKSGRESLWGVRKLSFEIDPHAEQ